MLCGHKTNLKISSYRWAKVVGFLQFKHLLQRISQGIPDLVFLKSLLDDLVSLKETHMWYCHQIWTAKIKSVREWPGKACTSACKGYILFTQPTITHRKVLSTKFFRIRQTASNEFQCKKIVLCQQQTPPLHILPIFFFFLSTC